MTGPRVTIAMPIFKRLEYLPNALACVALQDYDNIELIISDNAGIGQPLRSLVAQHYPKPFTYRQTPPVPISEHWNELIACASGEYFVLLCDDDEISTDFVSELVGLLQRHPSANAALARPETFDRSGVTRRYAGIWPELMGGHDFLCAWASKRLRLMSTVTLMARTAVIRAAGGYVHLPRALYSDNVLLLRLALTGDVVLGPRAIFRWRIDDASAGFSATWRDVAEASRLVLRFLETDAQVRAYAAAHSDQWPDLRAHLRRQCATWYFFRWKRYRDRVPPAEWVRAAFALPYVRGYYPLVRDVFVAEVAARLRALTGRRGG